MKEIIIPEQRIMLYEYSELTEEAKNTAKEKLLAEDPNRIDILSEYFNEELMYMFPGSSLRAQFSISSRQGDGVNIFGELSGKDAAQLLRDPDFEKKCEEKFSPDEVKRAVDLLSMCWNIRLPENPDYNYCMAGNANIALQVYEAAAAGKENIELSVKLDRFLVSCIETICRQFEEEGRKFLYDPDEEDVEEMAVVQKLLFLENGELYRKGGTA